jgi:2,3-bisphosphoglycerate-independent phosphoglycerate mutase
LLILDGFGISPDGPFNAITHAKMPTWQSLWSEYPHVLLDASGPAVGLPYGQMGNSEVGHATIGAGRILYQDLTRVDEAFQQGHFAENPLIQNACIQAQHHSIHLMGLLSPGGVHSHENHFFETIKVFAEAGCQAIYVHAFLDGRDVSPQSAEASLEKLMALCVRYPQVKPASICGRYYAMDRDLRWERTQLAYDALTSAKAPYYAKDPRSALSMAYGRGECDEFVKPTWIGDAAAISDGDLVFFINFRSDRARQLSRAFVQADFASFARAHTPKLSAFITMTEYAQDIPTQVIFPPISLKNSLGAYLAACDKTQLRIAETEKYAHVTFFFNGGEEEIFPKEERVLIPSPKVATYDLQPAMSAVHVTEQLVAAIDSRRFDVIVVNFANPDMLGHTGNFAATVEGLEVLDQCVHTIWQSLQAQGGQMLITSDHGNADCLFDEQVHQPHTAHTKALVPLVFVGDPAEPLAEQGTLADIAPTLLSLMGLAIPSEMTGHPMFQRV